MILVDSNVLIDIFDKDPIWFGWSSSQLERAAHDADLFVDPIVVAEVAPRIGSLETFMLAMAALLIRVEPLDETAAFLAGEAFRRYRERRRPDHAKSILADFLIGGHAQSVRATILTRDPRFYRTYFPELILIAPETEHG